MTVTDHSTKTTPCGQGTLAGSEPNENIDSRILHNGMV